MVEALELPLRVVTSPWQQVVQALGRQPEGKE